MIFFGIVGFLMKKFAYESTPLILAFILGPMFEEHFRRSLVLSFGSFGIFFRKTHFGRFPRAVAMVLLVFSLLPLFQKIRK